jgi:hypothetical protein
MPYSTTREAQPALHPTATRLQAPVYVHNTDDTVHMYLFGLELKLASMTGARCRSLLQALEQTSR